MKKWKIGLFAGLMMLVNTFSSVAQADVGVTQGKKMTPFSVMSLDGKSFELGYQGYPMVINFWATWCPPCKTEMPELMLFTERNTGVEFYAVSIQEDPATIRDFIRQNGIRFTPVIDTTGAAAQKYRVSAIPTTIVVNRHGEIIYRKTGPVTATELENVLKRGN